MRLRFRLLIFLALSWATLSGHGQELVINTRYVEPSQAVLNAWVSDYGNTPEIWIINNKEAFFNQLKSVLGSDDKTFKLLKHAFHHELPLELQYHLDSYYGRVYQNPIGGHIVLSVQAKQQLSSLVQAWVYQNLYSGNMPPLGISFSDLGEFEETIKTWKLPLQQELQLSQSIVHAKGAYHLPIHQSNWPLLPQSFKEEFIQDHFDINHNGRKGLTVQLKIRNEQDIEAAVRRYAENQNPAAVERYLRQKLAQAKGREILVPLERILSPFIRKKLNQYNELTGPNCFNAGLCVHQGPKYKTEYLGGYQLHAELKSDHTLMAINEVKSGDLLLYFDENGIIAHAATYIDKDLVFTKNGIKKFNPYIFQHKSAMEHLYFKEGFRLEVYRPNKSMQQKKVVNPEFTISLECLRQALQ